MVVSPRVKVEVSDLVDEDEQATKGQEIKNIKSGSFPDFFIFILVEFASLTKLIYNKNN